MKKAKLDAFSKDFPTPHSPRKRGPAARASKLSFLEEISDAELKMYSEMQLDLILRQRAHVSDLLCVCITSPLSFLLPVVITRIDIALHTTRKEFLT
jgi:hypothetical protein